MDFLPAPTTTNIALSNGRSRSPGLPVCTCSAHASSARARSSAKIVTLVDGSDTPELRRLVGEELIDGNRVEAQPRERRGAGPPQVMRLDRLRGYPKCQLAHVPCVL
jgi:hypothetical protein